MDQQPEGESDIMNWLISMLKKIPVLYLPYVVFFELFFDITAPIVNFYFLYLLRRPFFHPNLRIVLAQFSIGQILLTTTKVLMLVNVFWPYFPDLPEQIIAFVHNMFMYSMTNVSVLICCERLLASALAARYEQVRGMWLAVLASILMWVGNAIITAFCTLNIRAEVKHKPGTLTNAVENDRVSILLTCVMVVNIVGVMMFLLIRSRNRKQWRTELAKKLSHRYQIMENLRTARQMLIVLCSAFVQGFLFYLAITYTLVSEDRGFGSKLLMQLAELSAAVSANLLPCLFIKTHPRMWQTARRHLFRRSKVNVTQNVARGKSAADEEANVYFNQLQSSWNAPARR